MADLTIPAGAVTCRDGDPVLTVKAQVAVTGGQGGFLDLSNGGKANLADADAAASAVLAGVFVGDAAIGEYVTLARPGSVITVASSTFTAGVAYVVSTTAGGWAPLADLGSGDFVTYGLFALTTTTALVQSVQLGDIL